MWRTVQLVHAVRYEPITGKLYMSKLANPSVCVPRLGAAAVRERNYDWEWCARPRLRPLLACVREPTRRTYFEVKHKNKNAPNAHMTHWQV